MPSRKTAFNSGVFFHLALTVKKKTRKKVASNVIMRWRDRIDWHFEVRFFGGSVVEPPPRANASDAGRRWRRPYSAKNDYFFKIFSLTLKQIIKSIGFVKIVTWMKIKIFSGVRSSTRLPARTHQTREERTTTVLDRVKTPLFWKYNNTSRLTRIAYSERDNRVNRHSDEERAREVNKRRGATREGARPRQGYN